jgi:hypothetical protein
MKISIDNPRMLYDILRQQGIPENKLDETANQIAQMNQLESPAQISTKMQIQLPDTFETGCSNEQNLGLPNLADHAPNSQHPTGQGKQMGALGAYAFQHLDKTTQQDHSRPMYIIAAPGVPSREPEQDHSRPMYIIAAPGVPPREPEQDNSRPMYIIAAPGVPPHGADPRPPRIMYIIAAPGITPPWIDPANSEQDNSRPMFIIAPPGVNQHETEQTDPKQKDSRPMYIIPPPKRQK